MYQLLIADDEPLVADSLAKYVKWNDIGYQTAAVVYSVEEGIKVLKEKKIDIILTDIIMGEKTGLQFLEEALEIQPEAKGVIISGHEDFQFAKTAIRLGVYDYLVKPVDLDELVEVFSRIQGQISREQGDVQSKQQEEQEEHPEGMIVNKVKEYISIHFSENISLNSLAELVYVHPTYLSILFKKKTGKNFKDYLTAVRILKAKELLQDVSLRVSDVGNMVGYDGPKHFSKVFKEVTGMTPKDYRNR